MTSARAPRGRKTVRRGRNPARQLLFHASDNPDPVLQQFLFQRLDRKNSRHIGIVVMDPADGRVLAMAGYDKANPDGNPCLESRFPAASIFKIITAAAAVETRDLEPDSILDFRGGMHTLYRSQIDTNPAKRTNRVTLKDSFARHLFVVRAMKILSAALVTFLFLTAHPSAYGDSTPMHQFEIGPWVLGMNREQVQAFSEFGPYSPVRATGGLETPNGLPG